MKTSDYIVNYFINMGVNDVFGYPGGMVTHLMDSFQKRSEDITTHLMYHEQALAFAACSYAQATGKTPVVYATSGPGATNLITGICNAYFDSIPVIFITGQVNTFESSKNLSVRQRGFQETDIVSMVKPVTKKAFYVDSADKIRYYLDMAFFYANDGRKGPVLLDIPMDVFRTEIDDCDLETFEFPKHVGDEKIFDPAIINQYEKPVLLLGSGVKNVVSKKEIEEVINKLGIPVVTSMISFDVLDKDNPLNYGFIGAYGHRSANFIVAKSDLIISIGARLDIRQVGAKRLNFAPNATIIRFDIDSEELKYTVHGNDINYKMNALDVLNILQNAEYKANKKWLEVCNVIKDELANVDEKTIQEKIFDVLNTKVSDDDYFTADVGQNQVWVAQYLNNRKNNRVFFSGGHGSMGYSLPASVGLAYTNLCNRVISFNGDGGLQMNIQELQTIAKDNLPVIIIVFNNCALGMIRHFQEMYFNSQYEKTTINSGYVPPNFSKIAASYEIDSIRIESVEELKKIEFNYKKPQLIEIMINENTYVVPKLEFGKPNQDQAPLIDRNLYKKLMEL